MCFWLGRKAYRSIKARRAKGRTGADGGDHVSPSSTSNDAPVDPKAQAAKKAERKALIIQRVRIMAALAIPVFLETLDYTSKQSVIYYAQKPNFIDGQRV
jgi:hypothetical protein